ncbi:MAG: scramblase [bacterium]|nr:scramblase [bacterium]
MSRYSKCPKCKFTARSSFSECPRCGVIVSKFLQKASGDKQADQRDAACKNDGLQNLEQAKVLVIRQQKEWGEILTGFETKNRYEVMDHFNNPLIEAQEEGDSALATITRLFLKALRPFAMHLFSTDGTGLFKLTRPFRFYFHELDVCRSNGAHLGKIKRRFAILRRIYAVVDRNGNEIFELFGPLLRPWTFQIKKGGQELGKITKKWSGLVKESFTDADNFGITFPSGIDLSQKAVLLGAVFLIDFVHFENSGSRN